MLYVLYMGEVLNVKKNYIFYDDRISHAIFESTQGIEFS
jgi:hypothetical protein